MILALLALGGTPAMAQAPPASIEMIPGVPPGPRPPAQQVEDRARVLGRTLRCPVCQGSNITDSPSETAKAMYERTRQLLAAGYSEEQVVDYFVDKYGEFILLDPKGGVNILLFILPGLVLGLVLARGLHMVTQLRPNTPQTRPPPGPELEVLDDYERRLLAELNSDE